MGSRIGDVLPRKFVLTVYFYVAAGFSVVTAFTAWHGIHGWGMPLTSAVLAALLLLLPNAGPRQREFVQIDEQGVAVQTRSGREHVAWSDLNKVRILTTSEGPWIEDVYFLLETADGHGCAVPHEAAVRTRLLEELQARLEGVRDDKIIEAMGCTNNDSFTIWERR